MVPLPALLPQLPRRNRSDRDDRELVGGENDLRDNLEVIFFPHVRLIQIKLNGRADEADMGIVHDVPRKILQSKPVHRGLGGRGPLEPGQREDMKMPEKPSVVKGPKLLYGEDRTP